MINATMENLSVVLVILKTMVNVINGNFILLYYSPL